MREGRKHILIADDEESILLSVSLILMKAGYRVTSANRGEDALREIIESLQSPDPVDLLVCDLVMPGLSGTGLIEKLIAAGVCIPVVAMTGVIDPAVIASLRAKGSCTLLPKPFDRNELLARVAESFAGQLKTCLPQG